MGRFKRLWPLRYTLRFRLTLWFTVSLSFILIVLAAFLYLQLRRSLLTQVDTALQLVAAQALINLDEQGEQLAFQNTEINSRAAQSLSDDFMMRLLAPDGARWQSVGTEDEAPVPGVPAPGFTTLAGDDELWRAYSQEVQVGETVGWLQVLQELEPVQRTLQSLLAQMLWALPLAILLAALGGYLLATRMLRPVDRITRTAQSITATDLNRRIDHEGPADEIGRLAQTLNNMLDRLQMAFERERRFTGDAAHELRTPLAALKGRIGVTLSRPREAADYATDLQDMEQQVDRLIRLSNDLLYMARLDREQLEHLSESTELEDLMGAVVDQIRPLAESKSITLEEKISAGLMIDGNIDLLIRLFLNLLDNAIKFTLPGGRVTIWAQEHERELHIGVSDTGPGIPAEHLPHLFDRFYRVEEDRARLWKDNGQGGAGLGLAIAYEIARLHGGELTAQSESGQGATFIVELPATRKTVNPTRS